MEMKCFTNNNARWCEAAKQWRIPSDRCLACPESKGRQAELAELAEAIANAAPWEESERVREATRQTVWRHIPARFLEGENKPISLP